MIHGVEATDMNAPLSATEADTATSEACGCETAQWMRYPGVFLLGVAGCLLGLVGLIWDAPGGHRGPYNAFGAALLWGWLAASPARVAPGGRWRQGRTYARLLAGLLIAGSVGGYLATYLFGGATLLFGD